MLDWISRKDAKMQHPLRLNKPTKEKLELFAFIIIEKTKQTNKKQMPANDSETLLSIILFIFFLSLNIV